MTRVLKRLVLGYRRFISPGLHLLFASGGGCRFEPTCSAYCEEAIEKRGIFLGLMLSIYRLLRCNPLFKGGYDPVPKNRTSNMNSNAKSRK